MSSITSVSRAAAIGVLAVLMAATGAIAQDVGAPDAPAVATVPGEGGSPQACFLPPIKLAAEDIADFLAAPDRLLNDYPEGGILLSSRVRALAGSDINTLDPILSLVDPANEAQRAAIGSGLARAALACAPSDAAYAQLIQEKVASIPSDELLTAFLSATDDIETAALGAVGGGVVGAAPALGGVGNPGPSNSLEGDESNPNRSGNFPINRRSPLFAAGQSNSTGASSVSPTTTEQF